ncbi:two-component response regulator-like APRR9 isoform X2 [Typha latifolia]|uniref:two-component response regulator-like APRR9 isoform X2 n=1 Tax=Typha latifolia TaxID=4733 RepID=UPI003C306DCE
MPIRYFYSYPPLQVDSSFFLLPCPPNPSPLPSMEPKTTREEAADEVKEEEEEEIPAVRPKIDGSRPLDRHVIRWDHFLPRRSLRVLLVEHDDSTRHIVTALLRKCSYHVAAVADGLKAWEILKERQYAFDLVLTEVAMPSLSGIGLLSKIMATGECKNIPVIMMSSQDSIGVVLKCMLKGAVDFLVKPVRKNELRNLWQHVWRRHCASSQAYASDNNAASNHISANGSETGENSNSGSDAQSSESKQQVEIENAQNFREITKTEGRSSSREVEEKPEEPDGAKAVRINVLKIDNDSFGGRTVEVIQPPLSSAEKSLEKKSLNDITHNGQDVQQSMRARGDVIVGLISNHPNDSLKDVVACIEPIVDRKSSSSILEKDAFRENSLCEGSTSCIRKSKSAFVSSQPLERGPQINDSVHQGFKEKHILIHSNASAFSRYGDKRIQPSGQMLSSSLSIRSRESGDDERITCFQPKDILSSYQGNADESTVLLDSGKENVGASCSGLAGENASASHSSNGRDIVFHHPQFGIISLPGPVGAIPYQSLYAGYDAILQSMFFSQTSFQPHNLSEIEKIAVHITSDQSNCHGNDLVNHLHCDEIHNHEENHQTNLQRQQVDREAGDAINSLCTPMKQVDQRAICIGGIIRGSGSYGNGETADPTANTGTAIESGNESSVHNCKMHGSDSDRSRREAALIKFRLKRKDRCFEKKVRYHSRKKLAEQRPRVKGQFVRQKVSDSNTATEPEDWQ